MHPLGSKGRIAHGSGIASEVVPFDFRHTPRGTWLRRERREDDDLLYEFLDLSLDKQAAGLFGPRDCPRPARLQNPTGPPPHMLPVMPSPSRPSPASGKCSAARCQIQAAPSPKTTSRRASPTGCSRFSAWRARTSATGAAD